MELGIVGVLMILDALNFHNSGDGRDEDGEEDRSEDTPLRNSRITTPNVGLVVTMAT